MKDLLNPPAIVRKSELSRDARILLCKTLTATMRTRRRLNLESAIELGQHLLELKGDCQHGKWLPLLAEIGVSQQAAWTYMAFVKSPRRSDLEECNSITDAKALLQLGDGEEQEIGEEEAKETQYDAFPEDEHVCEGQAGEQTDRREAEEKKTEEQKQRKAYCDACKRCVRVGQQIPKRCKECTAIKKEEKAFTKREPKPPKGGFSLLIVLSNCKSIVRHLDNLCKDQGFVTEKGLPARPDWMERIVVALREQYAALKEKLKELKKAKKE